METKTGSSWFHTGYSKAKEVRDSAKNGFTKTPLFILKDKEKAIVRFVKDSPDEPVSFYTHYYKPEKKWFTCLEGTGETCPLCEKSVQRSFRGAYSLYDYRDKEVKFWNASLTVMNTIETIRNEYGTVLGREWVITRSGEGKATNYVFIAKDKSEPAKDVKLEAIDFVKFLKPKTRKQLLEVLEISEDSEGEVVEETIEPGNF